MKLRELLQKARDASQEYSANINFTNLFYAKLDAMRGLDAYLRNNAEAIADLIDAANMLVKAKTESQLVDAELAIRDAVAKLSEDA